jgi:hypothetical protein
MFITIMKTPAKVELFRYESHKLTKNNQNTGHFSGQKTVICQRIEMSCSPFAIS